MRASEIKQWLAPVVEHASTLDKLIAEHIVRVFYSLERSVDSDGERAKATALEKARDEANRDSFSILRARATSTVNVMEKRRQDIAEGAAAIISAREATAPSEPVPVWADPER